MSPSSFVIAMAVSRAFEFAILRCLVVFNALDDRRNHGFHETPIGELRSMPRNSGPFCHSISYTYAFKRPSGWITIGIAHVLVHAVLDVVHVFSFHSCPSSLPTPAGLRPAFPSPRRETAISPPPALPYREGERQLQRPRQRRTASYPCRAAPGFPYPS